MAVHIGSILKSVIEEKGITPSLLAKKLGVHIGSVSRMFRYRHMHAALLSKLSQALDHDFFKYYSKDLRIEIIPEKSEDTTQIADELKKEILSLKKENAYLKTINELLMKNK